MGILEWAAIGAMGLAMLVICARVMRRGIRTLDENRKDWNEQIRQAKRQIEKDNKNISSREHLSLLKAALEDLLRLDDQPRGHEVIDNGKTLELKTPKGIWQIELLMRERDLKSSRRTLHGRSRWRLSGFGHDELHMDPASLMRSLNGHLHDETEDVSDSSHILRRMSHLPQEPGHSAR